MKRKNKQKTLKQGFTLLELLVVVLIIGILAAIALPQYKKVVEKSRMAEAVTNVKAIAQAQQRYYLVNNEYVDCQGLNSLDIELSWKNYNYGGCPAKQTSNFVYTSGPWSVGSEIAMAQRNPEGHKYIVYISKDNPNRISCWSYSTASDIQKELCNKLRSQGYL